MSIIATTATESDEDCPARTLQLADAPSMPPTEASLEPSDRQPCTVHPDWCTETGNHYDHFGTLHTVKGNDGRELLNAHLLDLSGSKPIIGLADTDTTAAEARVKATELRRFADELETLADKVEVSASHEPSGTPQMTACPAGVSFCDGNPRDHEDPREHLHHGPLIAMGAHRPYE